MTTTDCLPDECIHGLVGGCVTCDGTDPMRDITRSAPRFRGTWTDEELEWLRDAKKTSREVAELTGRTVNQVSAQRIDRLGMTGYAGWSPKSR